MKKRKLLAVLLTLTMVMGSALTAQAANGDATGTSTITGTGDVDYVDTTIYKVVIPTTGALTLNVDPQGLAGLAEGESKTAAELAAYAGKVTGASTPVVLNASSVDMTVSVALTLTGDATGVTSEAAVEADTNNNILLYAVPSSTAVTSADDTAGAATGYTAGTTGVVITTSAATVEFLLPAAEYEYAKAEGTGALSYARTETPCQGTGISFAGLVNTKADWSDYVKETDPSEIGMTAVFSFAAAEESDELGETPAAAFMMDYAGTVVTLTASTQETDDYVMAVGEDGVVSYTFVDAPEGTLTVCKIDGSAKAGPVTNGYISYADGVLSIDKTRADLFFTTAKEYAIVATIGGTDYELTYTKQ